MPPKYQETVTVTTPLDPVVDPATGLETTPAPHVANVQARLSQQPVANIGGQVEQMAAQSTVISLWTLLVPPGTTLTSRSTVLDSRGRTFQVSGDVADRPNHQPQFRAAAVRLISDMQ
jgi:hypothetical protein